MPTKLAVSAAVLSVLAACSSPPAGPVPDPPCVQGLSVSCQATYAPATFDAIFTHILSPTCASGRGTCHTSDAAKGGLVFEVADDAYGRLLDGRRVLPGDPGCSLIMKRLTSTDPGYHMPSGSQSLTAGEQCTIVQWIAAGAVR